MTKEKDVEGRTLFLSSLHQAELNSFVSKLTVTPTVSASPRNFC